MRHPRTILRMHPVTLWGLGCSHEYVVGHRTGDSRLRGNDVGVWGCSPCTLRFLLICPSKGYAKVSIRGNDDRGGVGGWVYDVRAAYPAKGNGTY